MQEAQQVIWDSLVLTQGFSIKWPYPHLTVANTHMLRKMFFISTCLQLVLVSVDKEVYVCASAVAGMLQVSPEDLGAALTSDVQYFKGTVCSSASNKSKHGPPLRREAAVYWIM